MKTKTRRILLSISAVLAGLLAAWLVTVFHDLPDLAALDENLNQPSVRITDRDGRILYEIIPPEGGRHASLAFDTIPGCMKEATIAVEDQNFYTNPGVDFIGVLRALWIDIRGGEAVAGGSTITQQVVRNLLLEDERFERTLRRKLREAWLAWRLTQRYSKDEILGFYLNQVYYGGMAYGVEAAAQTYFGKPAAELLLPECALLAGLPQAPAIYNPYTNPDLARERQLVVLGLMEAQGRISPEERRQAEEYPLLYNPAPYPVRAPHFVWMVAGELDRLYEGGQLDRRDGLVVRTTLDLDAQEIAEAVVARNLESFRDPDPALDPHVGNAALVALDPRTGEILALVGSADYFDASIHGALNMATTPRQSGSAFKPFLYALALDPSQASPWTAATPILDVTTTFLDDAGTPYTPRNYDGREHGPVPLRVALGSSLNIPAVITLDHVGIGRVIDLAGQVGIASLGRQDEYNLSLALGGGEMSLLELTAAYATFANDGRYPGSIQILDITDFDGNLLYETNPPVQAQVFDPRLAWLISDILSDDAARTLTFGPNSILRLDRTAAVKTGTTSNFHDNWTIGYTPELVVGVWAGNAGYEPMRNVTGLTGAAPIWAEAMRTLLQGRPDRPFVRPDGLVQVDVCDLSGLLPTRDCAHVRSEWFIEGTEPTDFDTVYHIIFLDSATGDLASALTPTERIYPLTVHDLPTAAVPWAREMGLPLYADYIKLEAATQAEPILLLQPRPNTTYRLVDTFDRESQRLLVEAVAGQPVVELTMWVDDAILATFSAPPYRAWWPLAPGGHRFRAEAVLADGSRIVSETATITVNYEEP